MSEANQRLRAKRASEGLCRYCPEPKALGDSLYCAKHREQERKYASRKDREQKVKGLCHFRGCLKLPIPSRVFCQEHLDYRRQWNHKYLKKQREAGRCRSCLKPRTTRWYCDEHHRQHNEYSVKDRERIKQIVFARYGGQCVCCGESDLAFLTIDHVYGKGTQHRRDVGNELYRKILRAGFPKDYQLLCYNCNCAKRNGPYCPHELRVWQILHQPFMTQETARNGNLLQ